MQKKKPYFQAIPNCSINGVTNWNESKEVPAEQGRNDMACAISDARRPFLSVIRLRQTITALARLGSELLNPHPKMVQRNILLGAILARIRQSCSLNIQANYETLCAGTYSLP
jgi:hypothetical protein